MMTATAGRTVLLVLGLLQIIIRPTYSATGQCVVYNGTECAEFLKDKYVFIYNHHPLTKQEEKLKAWFEENQVSRQISRTCWDHAKALTCRKFYPECNVRRTEPDMRPLCPSHCDYVKEICKGEYARTLHSGFYQQYFPLCSSTTFFPDEICWKLPTYNPSEGPVIYPVSKKHVRKEVGRPAILKCSFGIKNFLWDEDNKGMIREGTWLRNGKRVTTNHKYSIRTSAKGKARLFMILRIRKTALKDAGKYQCEITFGNRTIHSSARLTVTKPGIIEIAGTCVKYTGQVCSAYLQNNLIFERANQPLEKMNKQLEMVIRTLKEKDKLSKRCEEFGQAVLCHYMFPQCHSKTFEPVESLCKSDCEAFHDDYCREELAMVAKDRMSTDLFVPNCGMLPDNDAGCLHINITMKERGHFGTLKNQIHNRVNEDVSCYNEDSGENYIGTVSLSGQGRFCDKWNKYPGYEMINHDHCRNFNEPKPWCFVENRKEYCNIKTCRSAPNIGCYKGNGGDYRGNAHISKSGKPCLQWNKVTPRYSNVDDSFCRNIEEDMEGPWCYVDHKMTMELCDIPKCSVSRHDKSVSLVTYVVPSIIGCTVLLFSLFLLVFYWKNKKLALGKHSRKDVVDIREEVERSSDESDFQKMSTISTTVSYEYKKEPSVVPSAPALTPVFHASFGTPPMEAKTQKRFRKNVPEVKEASLRNLVKIGDGKLGQLWQGEFCQSRDRTIPVLVRKLRLDTRPCVSSYFREEMNQLRCLKHPNIEQIVCVSVMSEIPFMAFDGNHKMDLKEYILDDDTVSSTFLLDCVYQIANGLDYLHQQRVLHKDLAARNCFITPSRTVYISKSGLGRYRYPEDYKNLPGHGLCPVRWLSPETLQTGIYRFPTDYYMLGMVMWELFSHAERPYSSLSDDDVIQEIMNGNKLACPANCPASIWNVVEQCWIMPGCQRPSAYQVKECILRLLELSKNVTT